jgi:hypothetical protein
MEQQWLSQSSFWLQHVFVGQLYTFWLAVPNQAWLMGSADCRHTAYCPYAIMTLWHACWHRAASGWLWRIELQWIAAILRTPDQLCYFVCVFAMILTFFVHKVSAIISYDWKELLDIRTVIINLDFGLGFLLQRVCGTGHTAHPGPGPNPRDSEKEEMALERPTMSVST